jgi:uncharacterized protein involved in exopolysaccharide biosynthesis
VHTEFLQTKGEVAGLEARYATATGTLQERIQAAAALPEVQAHVSQLRLQVTSATKAFEDARAAHATALRSNSSDTEELSLVESATRPLYPDRPLRYLFALVGLVVGIVGGTGVAFTLGGPHVGRRASANGRAMPTPGPIPQPAFAASVGDGAGAAQRLQHGPIPRQVMEAP